MGQAEGKCSSKMSPCGREGYPGNCCYLSLSVRKGRGGEGGGGRQQERQHTERGERRMYKVPTNEK